MTASRFLRSFVSLSLLGLFTASLASSAGAQLQPQLRAVPALDGFWEGPYDWPHASVHSALLANGSVLAFAYGTSATDIFWTEFDPVHYTGTGGYLAQSLFCGGHVLYADGRLMVAGGTESDPQTSHIQGPKHTLFFDPWTHAWSAGDDMNHGRYYPTLLTLGDGRVLALSGINEFGGYEPIVERYDSALGWVDLAGSDLEQDLYPRAHLLSFGGVFVAGPGPVSMLFDPTLPAWYPVATTQAPYRAEGCSVLLPGASDRVLLIGGTSDGRVGTETCEIIDLTSTSPSWQSAASMSTPRFHHNALILANGALFVFGGSATEDPESAVLPCELYTPESDRWRAVAPLLRARLYHSSGVLLPDGRVMVGGGDGEHSVEIYWPPYMFRPRPEIASVSGDLGYGSSFTIQLANAAAADIERVALIRPSATTHSVAMDQRFVDLAFVTAGDRLLVVDAPANPNLAPLGVYMLVVIDGHGTPSVAEMVYLD